jgi:PAS domain S-box-containing protein
MSSPAQNHLQAIRWVLLAVVMVVVCAAARWMLNPYLNERAPLSMFFIAVLVCAATSGFRAALLATLLSMLTGQMLFVEPRGYPLPVDNEQWFQWLVFVIVGVVISIMSGRLVAARDRERIFARRERVARDSLQESENRFRLMLDSMEDFAVFLIDSDRRIRSWNLGAERIFGLNAMEVEGTPYARLIDAADADAARSTADEYLAQAVELGRFELLEVAYLRDDKSAFTARVVLTALRDSSGDVRGFAHVARPVDDHFARPASHTQTSRA